MQATYTFNYEVLNLHSHDYTLRTFYFILQMNNRSRRVSPIDIAVTHIREETDTDGIKAQHVSYEVGE